MISRVANFTSSSRPAGDDRRPSITSESDWRVRIDAGTLFDMGCLLAGAGSHRRRFANPQRGCTPTKFSSKVRTSPFTMDAGLRRIDDETAPQPITYRYAPESTAACRQKRTSPEPKPGGQR